MGTVRKLNNINARPGPRDILVFIVLVLTFCATPARCESFSWLDWWFELLSADQIPQQPILTERDQAAIEKIRVLLDSQPPDAVNSLILGMLASAEGKTDAALGYFTQSSNADTRKSLLPMTMGAQVYLQQGENKKALAQHRRIVAVIAERRNTPQMQIINAHLDLAVAYSKLDELEKASEEAKKAATMIKQSNIVASQKTLAYLQLGIVYNYSLSRKNDAKTAWKRGEEITSRRGITPNPRVALELNLNIAEVTTDHEKPVYLGKAARIARQLPAESKAITQVQIAEQYVSLAERKMASGVSGRKIETRESKRYTATAKTLLSPAQNADFEKTSEMALVRIKALEIGKEIARQEESDLQINRFQLDIDNSWKNIRTRQDAPWTNTIRPIKMKQMDIAPEVLQRRTRDHR